MRDIAALLDDAFNGPKEQRGPEGKKTGFALLVFPFGQPNGEHRSNYISNANREDMIATLKEFVARAEGRFQEANNAPQ